MSSPTTVELPARWAQRHIVDGNSARQRLAAPCTAMLERDGGQWLARTPGGASVEIRARGGTPPGSDGLELSRTAMQALPSKIDAEDLRWVSRERCTEPTQVLEALAGRFTLRTEDRGTGSEGLRIPQAGAVHAVLAHWSTGANEPATVVLPTGTGKTETMLALFVGERLTRLLVLVPSDRLRAQIAEVFETYGILARIGVLDAPAIGPVIGRLEHHFKNASSMRSFVDRCNVLVTTPDALNASSGEIVDSLVGRCTHLFVDEAHHVPAKSWSRIRERFAGKPVLQFTATPYRADGERLGGKVIYSFPLGLAQQLKYFQRISYISVVALAEPDRRLAEEAVKRLSEDREQGYDHLIMARVSRIGRARDEILPLYQQIAPDLEPQILHSDLKAPERAAAVAAIKERRSRIIVCVDMLGEGFDFPELKIAALHDPHRSLGVALQFIGRFARSRPDLGTATAVLARPEPGYDQRLRALYAEGNEWDQVIDDLSSQAIEQVRELDDFESGFARGDSEELAVHALKPKMSTVVYRTDCAEWQPERLAGIFARQHVIAGPTLNAAERVLWSVVETRTPVRWGHMRSIVNVAYHLHVLHWDRERALLYINSSELESLHEDLAQAVCGESVQRITGEAVYRVLGDISRPVPTNIGVIDVRNRSRRFSMYVGADVYEGFPVAEQQTKSNTNIFVFGYEEGERMSMGAAAKGRIWSQQAADSVLEWVRWCRRLGPKLQDETIALDALFRSFVRPKPLEERPALTPLAIDWPWLPFAGISESVKLNVAGAEHHLIDVELALVGAGEDGPIGFLVRGDSFELPYEVHVDDGQLVHRALDVEARVVHEHADPETLSDYLNREGSNIWFEEEIMIEGPELCLVLERDRPPIDLDQLLALDWSGIDITRESEGPGRDPTTVQAHAAARLASLRDWDVIIDDDDTGEIADLVALKEQDDRVLVHLVHCKYSSKPKVGARVEDLYELCGQAHRSAHHRQQLPAMVKNLIRRERNRRVTGPTRLLLGDDERLLSFQDAVRLRRPEMHITIVQPGFGKAQALPRHLQLLAAADVYVKEIAYASFDVWCSP